MSEVTTTWSDTATPGGEFINVKPGIEKSVRLLGEPTRTYKVFVDHKQCIMVKSLEIGEALQAKYPDRIDKTVVRYVCYCIDRGDDKIKVLDIPPSLAKIFGSRVDALKMDISKREGCDWMIKTNGKVGIECRYEAIFIEPTTLTDNEFEAFKQVKKDLKAEYDGKTFAEADAEIK